MNNKVKTMQLAIGVDLIGSKMSMAASKIVDLEATAIGIKMYSKKSNRTVIIPYSNVKGFELMLESDTVPDEVEETPESPKKKGKK